jgi:molybdopterin synthase catalytic subunit
VAEVVSDNWPGLILGVSVQREDFDVGQLQRSLLEGDVGALACFTGYVRAGNADAPLERMRLEHYPGMTEKCIADILQQASGRWPLMAARVVHRVGDLSPGEQIVWVGVASRHRAAAFSACEFIMDYLKTQAPFWKKEQAAQGSRWVDASLDDEARAQRWQQSPGSPE